MKKIISILIIAFFTFTLSSCELVISLLDEIISKEYYDYEYPDYDYGSIKTASDLYEGFMPSTGDVHTLVLLVEFPGDEHNKKHNVVHMKKAFYGDGSEFESVSSYYKKSSYGALNITGDVYGWYELSQKANSYTKKYGSYASDVILNEVISYYVINDLIDLSDYDSDNDGFVDAISVIYSKEYNENSDTWWAYQTMYMHNLDEGKYLEYDDMKISNYLFASAHFLEESNEETLTFIHETGHLMGLDDYYDYDILNNTQLGLGGADMMDENVGDHSPISKIILGWIDPIIVDITKTNTYEIDSFTKTGDVLLIPKSTYNGIFDEYYLVELYDPSGLNSTSTYLTSLGVRVLHVDASIGEGGMDGEYFTYFNCDNSDTDNPFVDTVVKRKGLFKTTIKNEDLFYTNEVLNDLEWYDDTSLNLKIKVVNIDKTTQSATIEIIVD